MINLFIELLLGRSMCCLALVAIGQIKVEYSIVANTTDSFRLLACFLIVLRRNQWQPMSLLIVYCLMPLPVVGCGIGLHDPFGSIGDSVAAGWRQFGLFLEGLLVTSAIGIPLVLYHVAAISGATFAFTLISGLILLTSLALFVGVSRASQGGGFFSGW